MLVAMDCALRVPFGNRTADGLSVFDILLLGGGYSEMVRSYSNVESKATPLVAVLFLTVASHQPLSRVGVHCCSR